MTSWAWYGRDGRERYSANGVVHSRSHLDEGGIGSNMTATKVARKLREEETRAEKKVRTKEAKRKEALYRDGRGFIHTARFFRCCTMQGVENRAPAFSSPQAETTLETCTIERQSADECV